MHIGNYLEQEKVSTKNERNYLMNEIYSLYFTEQERVHNKKYRWKLYVGWLKENRLPDTKENQEKFKKTKIFKNTKGFSAKRMASFFLSHVKTKDLYFVLSVVKDRYNRNQSVGQYIKSLVNIVKNKDVV